MRFLPEGHSFSLANRSSEVGSPCRSFARPSSEVGSPCRSFAGPSSEVGSPCRSLAGPSSEVGSPCRSLAGPSSEVGSPCRSFAGPSSEVGSLIYAGGGRPLSFGLDMLILSLALLEDFVLFAIGNLFAAASVRAERMTAVSAGTGTDNMLMLQLHHPHRGLHIFSFHCVILSLFNDYLTSTVHIYAALRRLTAQSATVEGVPIGGGSKFFTLHS